MKYMKMIFVVKEFLKMPEIIVQQSYIDDLKYKISKLQDTISFLKQENHKFQEERDHAEFRILTELEPRIKQEKRSYDFWITQQTGAEQCDHFKYLVDELCDFVDSEYQEYFEWENTEGDLYDMILFLIKNKKDIDIYKIEEKENNA